MNIPRKCIFLLLIYGRAGYNSSDYNVDNVVIDCNPLVMICRAIISGMVASQVVSSGVPEKKGDTPLDEVGVSKDNIYFTVFNKFMDSIKKKYGCIIVGNIVNGIYGEVCFSENVYKKFSNPYMDEAIRNFTKATPESSLAKISNELNLIGNVMDLSLSFSKFKKSLMRLVSRWAIVTKQSLVMAGVMAGLYKVSSDKVKDGTDLVVKKIPFLDDKAYLKQGVGVVAPIAVSVAVLDPLFEHYLIPLVQGTLYYVTEKCFGSVIPTKTKIDNISSFIKMQFENFYEYDETEEIKDYQDSYVCLKYGIALNKICKNIYTILL